MLRLLRSVAFSASLLLAAAGLPPQPAYPGLALVFEDDFDAPVLNGAVWMAVDGFVQTPYAQVCYQASNVAVSNGVLVLTTRAESVSCTFHDTGEM